MLLTHAVNAPSNASESRVLEWNDVISRYRTLFLGGEDIGTGISSAENLSPVAAAHRILCNGYALIPFDVYQKDGDARRSVKDVNLAKVLKHRPNPNASPFNLRHTQMSNAYWWGWGAIWNVRDVHGAITERYALPSDCGSIRRDPETGNYWYDFNVDGVSRTFASYELSILLFESYDGIHGRGMVHLAREAIASDGMAQRYQKKFYQNGARLSGIVHVATDASKDTRDRVRKSFSRYASDDAFKVAVLDHGMTFTPMGLNQRDAQYIESRGFTVEEIARFTGVPKYMMQTGKEAYNSNQQQRVDFVTDTLVPFVTQAEQEETYKLLNQFQRADNWYIKGNVSVLLRGDDKSRAAFYKDMIQFGIRNPDECRALEELDPIPGGLGKEFLVTKNLGSLAQVLKGEA